MTPTVRVFFDPTVKRHPERVLDVAARAVIGARADHEAADVRLNEAILNAVEAGWSFRKLSKATGISVTRLHVRAGRAKESRPRES